MDVTVTMRAEEFIEFRAYQQDKKSLEETIKAPYQKLKRICKEICNSFNYAIDEAADSTIEKPHFEIQSMDNLSDVMDFVNEAADAMDTE